MGKEIYWYNEGGVYCAPVYRDVLPEKQLVTIMYKCGHEREKFEFVHEGHDIQDKLNYFKENTLCHECRRL